MKTEALPAVTPIRWESLGKIFGPEMGPKWMRSHAQVPTPLVDEEAGIIRVYFASRPEPTRTLVGFVDLDARDPAKVLRVSEEPVLEPGCVGTFDEHGVMPSCALRVGAEVYLYYSGWSRSVGVPYTNSTGLAVSSDGGLSFRKVSAGPVLAKSVVDPFSATSPFVLRTAGEWFMWYCSGTGWIKHADKLEHVYDIKLALSPDGIHWRATGKTILAADQEEEALTRPWVFYERGWQMIYCHRKARDFRDGEGAYHLGIAASADLNQWRKSVDADDLWPRENWDDKAQAYPAVAEVDGHLYLFLNGNGFGAGGFGLWRAPK